MTGLFGASGVVKIAYKQCERIVFDGKGYRRCKNKVPGDSACKRYCAVHCARKSKKLVGPSKAQSRGVSRSRPVSRESTVKNTPGKKSIPAYRMRPSSWRRSAKKYVAKNYYDRNRKSEVLRRLEELKNRSLKSTNTKSLRAQRLEELKNRSIQSTNTMSLRAQWADRAPLQVKKRKHLKG